MPNPVAVIPTSENLIKTDQAAAVLGVSPAFLERDRCRKVPTIPFVRLSARAVRYRPRDLQAVQENNLVGGVGE